ncbi:hypothetical protein ACLB2K_006094 [Fragaria x ananassa]
MEGEIQKPQKWTAEEAEALLAGVAKHGVGNWKIILEDSEFGSILTRRSNMKLKYKWRHWSRRPSESSPSMADEALEEAESVSNSDTKEEDRVSETKERKRMPAEDTEYMLDLESMLQLASEIYERFS